MRIFQTHVNVSTLSFDSKDNSRRKLAEALLDAPQLRSVTLPAWVGIKTLKRLASSNTITSITLLNIHMDAYLDMDAYNKGAADIKDVEDAVAREPNLSQLVSFREHSPPPVSYSSIISEPLTNHRQNQSPETHTILLPTDPTFIPLRQVSQELQEEIWSRILYFATECDESLNETRYAILEVSETFNVCFLLPLCFSQELIADIIQRLATPYAFKNVFFSDPQQLSDFLTRLSSEELSLGRHVRSLMYSECFCYQVSPRIEAIVPYTPYLSRIGPASCYIPGELTPKDSFMSTNWIGLEALAERVGSNLITLHHIVIDDEIHPKVRRSPVILSKFTRLDSLHGILRVEFEVKPRQIQKSWLGNLTVLAISRCELSFLRVLNHLEYAFCSDSTIHVLTFVNPNLV
jgi:hypothetical protein